MNKRNLLLGSLFAAGVLAVFRQEFVKVPSAKPASKASSYPAIDAYVKTQMHRLSIPGAALAIVEGDKIVHLRGFGRARPGGEAPCPQTPFFIGSLTKSFTALAVMQLVEAGKIELEAAVQRYLPWFSVADSQASAQITVRHLLNQTSGLPTSAGESPLADGDNSPGAAERQARALAAQVLNRPVGSAFEYCNSNYVLLGLIIEAASGESYSDYIQRHIFSPLGMSHSYTSRAAAKQNGLALGYRYWFAAPFAAPNMPIPYGSLAGGMLISCAEDMARYLGVFLNGGRCGEAQILSQEGIDELQRGSAEVRTMGMALGKYAMGWFIDKIGQTKLAWHGGTLPDFAAFMGLLPEQKKGVILLFNADHHYMTPVVAEIGTGVTALLAGEQPAPPRFGLIIPWALRSLLLIPLLQIAGVAATQRQLQGWRRDPASRPKPGRMWGRHILLPLIPNLAPALTLVQMLGKRRGYLKLYMPDYALIAMLCGSFAGIWSLLRTGLMLRMIRKPVDQQS